VASYSDTLVKSAIAAKYTSPINNQVQKGVNNFLNTFRNDMNDIREISNSVMEAINEKDLKFEDVDDLTNSYNSLSKSINQNSSTNKNLAKLQERMGNKLSLIESDLENIGVTIGNNGLEIDKEKFDKALNDNYSDTAKTVEKLNNTIKEEVKEINKKPISSYEPKTQTQKTNYSLKAVNDLMSVSGSLFDLSL
jgi:phosphopantetheine adenylyltransferase